MGSLRIPEPHARAYSRCTGARGRARASLRDHSVKLLFDENLSPRLVSVLSAHWPESAHVINQYARSDGRGHLVLRPRSDGFTLVSKDDDFRSLALARGAPLKVVWLQIGNAPTSKVADLLRANILVLEAFSNEPAEALISLRG
jgi:predicted nuclease of predicted toxin-antitoxin system